MQQQPTNPNITNPAVEVALIVIAGVFIIIGAVLLYLGKIDIGFASFLFMTAFSAAFGLVGINLAYKAPSPTQQAQLSAQQTQLSAQQQTVQQIASQAMAVLPMFANLLHTHAPTNVAVPQQQAQAQPPQGQTPTITSMAGTAPTAVMRQPVTQSPVVQPVPVPQPTPQAVQASLPQTPPLPQAAMAGQQFKPPVFTPLPDISMPMAAMPAAQQPPTQS